MVQRIIRVPEKLSFFLFGPRQTGKSTLVETLFTDQTWTVDFLLSDTFYLYERDPSQFRRDALYKIEKESVSTIVIDEVQRLPVLLNEVHFLLEKCRHIRFILTGSSARKLKRGASNLLAGRAVERHLYPFVWNEISGHLDLETMLHFGTLPGVYELNPREKKEALRAYVNTYLKEEIRSEALTRKLSSFSQFLDIAGAQFGHQLNFTAIGRDVGLSTKTVQIWYEILEDTLIGFRLDPWRKSVRKRLSARPKFYFFDCGVTNAVNRVISGDFDHFYRGRLFEQFLVGQIKYTLDYLNEDVQLFYWRTSQGTEVDLLIVINNRFRAACEIKYTARIQSSHLSGLKAFREDNPGIPLFVLAETPNPYTRDGISVLPWSHFLENIESYAGLK